MRKILLIIGLIITLLSMSGRSDNSDKENDCDGYYVFNSWKVLWPILEIKKYSNDLPILDFQSAKGKATIHFIYSPKIHVFYVMSLGNGVYEIQSTKNKMKIYLYIEYDSEWTQRFNMSFFTKYDGKSIPSKREGDASFSKEIWKDSGWNDLEKMKIDLRYQNEHFKEDVKPINENSK